MITELRTFLVSLLAAVTIAAFVLLGPGVGEPKAAAATTDSFELAAVGDMNPSGNTSTTSASGRNAASIAAGLADGSLHNFIGIGDFQYDKGTCAALPAWNTLWGGVKAKTFWTAGPGHDVRPGVNDDVDRYMNGECVSTTKSATSTTLGRFQDALEWYATDQGNWHIVFAPTAAWLYNATRAQAMTAEMDADMKAATTAGRHLAVVYHDPYFTSDTSAHTRFTQAKPWIDMFWANRVKVLLSGSQHNYVAQGADVPGSDHKIGFCPGRHDGIQGRPQTVQVLSHGCRGLLSHASHRSSARSVPEGDTPGSAGKGRPRRDSRRVWGCS